MCIVILYTSRAETCRPRYVACMPLLGLLAQSRLTLDYIDGQPDANYNRL